MSARNIRVSAYRRKLPRKKKAAMAASPLLLVGSAVFLFWLYRKYSGYYSPQMGQTRFVPQNTRRDAAQVWRHKMAQISPGAPGYEATMRHLYATGQTPTGPGGVWSGTNGEVSQSGSVGLAVRIPILLLILGTGWFLYSTGMKAYGLGRD